MLSIQASFRSVVKHAKRAKTVRGNEPFKIGDARFRRSDLHVKHMETARQKKMLTTPVSGEDKEGTGNGSKSRQRKAGATMENPAQFLKTGSFED